jgi:hypothetical protein
LERNRELHSILENLQMMLSNGNGEASEKVENEEVTERERL